MTARVATGLDLAPTDGERHRTLWQDAARRFLRNRLAVIGLAIVLLFLFLAVFADLVAPFPYDKVYFAQVSRKLAIDIWAGFCAIPTSGQRRFLGPKNR
ncbi:MAG: hypothetical protein OXO50_01555 [Caldilineaceae bacterium]|nr:hypothetical protein [Caldilineaceae bacterium]